MDHIDEFIKFAKALPDNGGGFVRDYGDMFKATAKELKRLRKAEAKRADLSRRNGKGGGRPRSADAAIKPASLKRREYRAKDS